jgi:hypothetical protein
MERGPKLSRGEQGSHAFKKVYSRPQSLLWSCSNHISNTELITIYRAEINLTRVPMLLKKYGKSMEFRKLFSILEKVWNLKFFLSKYGIFGKPLFPLSQLCYNPRGAWA